MCSIPCRVWSLLCNHVNTPSTVNLTSSPDPQAARAAVMQSAAESIVLVWLLSHLFFDYVHVLVKSSAVGSVALWLTGELHRTSCHTFYFFLFTQQTFWLFLVETVSLIDLLTTMWCHWAATLTCSHSIMTTSLLNKKLQILNFLTCFFKFLFMVHFYWTSKILECFKSNLNKQHVWAFSSLDSGE